jgi:hypothetical protein
VAIFIILELVLPVLAAVFVIFQILIPVVKGTPLFPMFTGSKRRKLEQELIALREKQELAAMEDRIAALRRGAPADITDKKCRDIDLEDKEKKE